MKQNPSLNLQKKTFKKATFPKIYNKKIVIGDANKISHGLGLGLFAYRDIKKGENLFIIKGKLVKLKIKNFNDSMSLPNAIGIANNVWIDPISSNALVYLNHSCEPNVGIKGQLTVIAIRNISKGEHIVIDYSITEGDKLWSLPSICKCGSSQCRKKIRSIHYLPEKTYQNYLPYIPAFLQKEYKKLTSL